MLIFEQQPFSSTPICSIDKNKIKNKNQNRITQFCVMEFICFRLFLKYSLSRYYRLLLLARSYQLKINPNYKQRLRKRYISVSHKYTISTRKYSYIFVANSIFLSEIISGVIFWWKNSTSKGYFAISFAKLLFSNLVRQCYKIIHFQITNLRCVFLCLSIWFCLLSSFHIACICYFYGKWTKMNSWIHLIWWHDHERLEKEPNITKSILYFILFIESIVIDMHQRKP